VVSKEETTKSGFTKDKSTHGRRAFVDVKQAWPPEHLISFLVCEELHARLTNAAKEEAYRGVAPYLADCRATNRKICDLATYYRERRWERFAQIGAKPGAMMINRKDHPTQCARWRDYKLRIGEPISFFDQQLTMGHAYSVPSEWPPALPERISKDGAMSEDDETLVMGKR
jgi:hypothetical protein